MNDATTTDRWSSYVSPLSSRYASDDMQAIWSPRRKFETWRRIWLALAESQHELGLDVSAAQVDALRKNLSLNDDDFERAREHESRLRHDVMAHVHALGDVAPEAAGIIHLGATSQDVNCNTEIPQLRDALVLTCARVAAVIDALGTFAATHRDRPCLGLTHYQPAQPTTVGKRAACWAYDLALCLERLERTTDELRLRGMKGATGTQASFLNLFEGDAAKVAELEQRVASKLGWSPEMLLLVTGQTYPRVVDSFVLADIASLASVLHKMCNDIRLLSNRKELDEPFASSQIGSSAMPYKRNPMRCERATSLCRFVMSQVTCALDTSATQWLERTLDDSASRRIILPEAFLATDASLLIMHNVSSGLIVNEATVRANLMAELPFMVSENLMMEAVKLGRDRQDVHEAIRQHAQAAGQVVKQEGKPNDLIDRLRAEPLLEGVDLDGAMSPELYVGLAPQQVDRFVDEIVSPVRAKYADVLGAARDLSV